MHCLAGFHWPAFTDWNPAQGADPANTTELTTSAGSHAVILLHMRKLQVDCGGWPGFLLKHGSTSVSDPASGLEPWSFAWAQKAGQILAIGAAVFHLNWGAKGEYWPGSARYVEKFDSATSSTGETSRLVHSYVQVLTSSGTEPRGVRQLKVRSDYLHLPCASGSIHLLKVFTQ